MSGFLPPVPVSTSRLLLPRARAPYKPKVSPAGNHVISHLSTRQFQALVLCKLEKTRADVKNLRELFVDRFSAVLLSPKLTPIPRPVQGKEIKRSSNVTKILREEIERRNSKKMELGRHSEETPEPLYLQFDAEVNDTRLNSEAMKSIETIMRVRNPKDFQKHIKAEHEEIKRGSCDDSAKDALPRVRTKAVLNETFSPNASQNLTVPEEEPVPHVKRRALQPMKKVVEEVETVRPVSGSGANQSVAEQHSTSRQAANYGIRAVPPDVTESLMHDLPLRTANMIGGRGCELKEHKSEELENQKHSLSTVHQLPKEDVQLLSGYTPETLEKIAKLLCMNTGVPVLSVMTSEKKGNLSGPTGERSITKAQRRSSLLLLIVKYSRSFYSP